MKRLFLLLISIFILIGCNPGSEVKIKTGGIFTPTLFAINNQDADGKTIDLGEHILTDDPIVLEVTVYNNTKFPYTDLDLTMSANDPNSPSIKLSPSPLGETNFPGYGGTCSRSLAPNTSCKIKLLLEPREERTYLETIKLNFKNYVDAEEHTAQIVLLAGMPASLVFTNDKTQYTFGNLVGAANLPVAEREDLNVYTEELEIINAGGLSARSIVVTLTEACASTLTSLCPTGMFGAYVINNNCPQHLLPGETCKITLKYLPKNQDPSSGIVPDEIKEINYRATLNLSYLKDPKDGTGGLNGYFRSVSANIEARFKVALASLVFETPIISGNRETRTFRINNLGYREGEIKSLDVRGIGGSLIATCKAHETSEYLSCFDSSNTLLSLADFPFTIKDRNNCIAFGAEAPTLIDIGNGCIFDLIFQPSVTYLTDKMIEFQNLQAEVVYDSRWKGLVKIVTSKIFYFSAQSLAAARLVPNKLLYEGVSYPVSTGQPAEIDLGRLTLQSPNFFKRKPIIIYFKNIGSTPASGLGIKDALNRTILIGGAAVSLGQYSQKYYALVTASDTTCNIVNPGESCSISMMFAPIGRSVNSEETENMFDGIDLNGKDYKGFVISYNNGSLYTDNNRSGDPDYITLPAKAHLFAKLLRKGMLMQMSDDARNVSNIGNGINMMGDTTISYVYLQNIGTGTIPYVRLMNPPTTAINPDFILTNTSDPAALGADFDCLNLVDIDNTGTVPANATPTSRVGNFVQLPKDKSCVYRLEMKKPDSAKRRNSLSCDNTIPASASAEEGARLFGQSLSGSEIWEHCRAGNYILKMLSHDYYDGDATDPALPPGSVDGKRITLPNYTYQVVHNSPAKLIPYSFSPPLTATLYRPEVIYPALSPSQTGATVAEKWFYGLAGVFYYEMNDSLQTSPFIQGDESRNFVTSLVGYANRSSYDYILYLGSFPEGSAPFNFPLSIQNTGNFRGKLTSFTTTADPGFSTLSAPTPPTNVTAGSEVTPLLFDFNPSTSGEHHMVVEYNYDNGQHINPLIYESSAIPTNLATAGLNSINQKILVIAHVQQSGTYPSITMSAQDYDVVQNEGAPPTETLGGTYPVSLSWNNSATTSSLLFDTIKLTAPPTANDVYAKKILTFTNSSSFSLVDFKALFKTNTTSPTSKVPTSTFKSLAAGSTCTNAMTLAPGASCKLILKYQPGAADTSEDFVLTLVYQMGVGQYVMQNTSISLLPRSPGNITALGLLTETINYKVSPVSSTITRFSYPLSVGTSFLDAVPKAYSFHQSSGGYKKLQFVNTQTTKASLLLSYQRYLSTQSLRGYSPTVTPPTWVIPTAGEYRSYEGLDYAIIHRMNYSNGSERVRIEASKGCLFGDDENNGSIPSHQKGFNGATSAPCFALVYFNANFEYLNKSILGNKGDDMRGTASELWYYSVNRSSTASLWIHIKGTIYPDISNSIGNYTDVKTRDNKTASFITPKMAPNNPVLGDLRGLRVLYSTSSTALNSPYTTSLKYVDVRPYDPLNPQYANIVSDLANGQYFWFRTVAIRYHAGFVDSVPARFVGLAPGEYLSATSANITMNTLVPPLNHHYFHTLKLLVDKDLTGGVAYDPHLTSKNRCTQRSRVTLKKPNTVTYPYQLINSTVWPYLMATPAASNYSNMSQISHWLQDNPVSIDVKCGGLPGFVPNNTSQLLNSSYVFYIRNGSNPSANVNTAYGGVPGTSYSDYSSYIDGTIGYASARCMVILP
jgi:hypothetical protein